MHLAEKFGLPIFTFDRHAGRLSGHRRRRARAVRGDRRATCTVMAELQHADHQRRSSARAARAARSRSPSRDRMLMLQYSTYSVISPEGCASILWKSAAKAPGGGRGAGADRATACQALQPDRRDRQRAARRRAPRSRGHGRPSAPCARRFVASSPGHERNDLRERRFETPDGLRQVQETPPGAKPALLRRLRT